MVSSDKDLKVVGRNDLASQTERLPRPIDQTEIRCSLANDRTGLLGRLQHRCHDDRLVFGSQLGTDQRKHIGRNVFGHCNRGSKTPSPSQQPCFGISIAGLSDERSPTLRYLTPVSSDTRPGRRPVEQAESDLSLKLA